MTFETRSGLVLDVQNLSTSFNTEDGVVRAVDDVSFHVRPGEVLAIVGESGSGKTVLALSIMGLLPSTATVNGHAYLGETDLLALSTSEMRRVLGKDIAMVFQDPMTAFNPVFSIGNQIAEAIRVHDKSVAKKAAYARAAELLELVGIPEAGRRVHAYPHEFSGGMRQRAMIAMAIANGPKLLIADEPTTALDVTIQAQVLDVMTDVREATGAAMILITHDLGLVAGLADRVQVMYAGHVFETGETSDIYYKSANPYTRGLMTSIPRLDERTDHRLNPITGAPPSLIHLPAGCPFRPRCEYSQDICHDLKPNLREIEPTHESRCHYAEALPAFDPITGIEAEL